MRVSTPRTSGVGTRSSWYAAAPMEDLRTHVTRTERPHMSHVQQIAPVDRYLSEMNDVIPGWLNPEDAMLFRVADALQFEAGIRGDILEIGAFYGKTSVLL